MPGAQYDPTARFNVDVSDVEYLRTVGDAFLARIYQPQGPGPFPGVVEVHGGAWCGGDRTNDDHINRRLAESGIVVAALDYQLAPQHPYPKQVQDVNFGVRWLKSHAGEFKVDPDQVGGVGASSGGHVIVLSAMKPLDDLLATYPEGIGGDVNARLAFVISLWGIVDPYARYQYAVQANQERLATNTRAFFMTEDGMQSANPQMMLDRGEQVELPPLLVIQGDQDMNIPWEIPQKFAQSWQRAGGQAQFEKFPGQPHGFANTPGPETDRAIDLMKQFIARTLTARVPA